MIPPTKQDTLVNSASPEHHQMSWCSPAKFLNEEKGINKIALFYDKLLYQNFLII